MTDGIRIHTPAKTSPECPMGSCVVNRSCYHVTFLCCWLLTMPLWATVQCLLCTCLLHMLVRQTDEADGKPLALRLYVHNKEELTLRNGPSYSRSQQLLPPTKRLCFYRCPSVGWLVCKQDHTKTTEQNSTKGVWSIGLHYLWCRSRNYF